MERKEYNTPFALTLDVGTQSIRGTVFSPDGELLWKKKKVVDSYYHPQQGYSEIDPKVYLDTLKEIVWDLKREDPELQSNVRMLCISCMRDCVVPVDENGKPLRPMILWFDERKNEKVYPDHPWVLKILSLVGAEHLIRENSQASHINWIKDHEPEIWSRTRKVIFLSTYLHYYLVGKFIDSTSNQTGHICFDSKAQDWSGPLDIKKYVFPVDKEKLCEIVQPGEILGNLTKQAAEELGMSTEVTVAASASDKACESLGSGCVSNEQAVISLGSQTTVQTLSDRYLELERFVPSFPAAIPHRWNPEVQINRGYWMVSRFLDELDSSLKEDPKRKYELLDEFLRTTPAGNDGMVMYPYIGGCPSFPNASGSFMGIRDYHTKANLFRALIEGINLTLMMTVERIEKLQKKRIGELILVGGGAENDQIAQITADMFQRPVRRLKCWDSTALGAAIQSYVAMGVFSDYEQAIKSMIRTRDVFMPCREHEAIYRKLYLEFRKDIGKKIHFLTEKNKK